MERGWQGSCRVGLPFGLRGIEKGSDEVVLTGPQKAFIKIERRIIMGSGCYRVPNRNLFFVGGHCENGCFRDHGGCEASSQFEAAKSELHCELKPENKTIMKPINEVYGAIERATKDGKTIFLYTPDMFSDAYFDRCFKTLQNRNGNTYIAINASVRNLTDKGNWSEIYAKGIREIWIGVESASKCLRDKYFKIPFTNNEVREITKQGQKAGINICWFLVDGVEDTIETRLETYQMIKDCDPYRVHIGELT